MDNVIKVIIGLGNPGAQYYYTRHNIGFRIVDALAEQYGGQWTKQKLMESAHIVINEHKILLVKPQTYMNESGRVMPTLLGQGITIENVLVVHDELEKKFGNLSFKVGGSHKGHNGLRSIIHASGKDFVRFRFGIGRPESQEEVSNYVLSTFGDQENEAANLIIQSVNILKEIF